MGEEGQHLVQNTKSDSATKSFFKDFNLRYFLRCLILGQVISLLLCSTAVCSGLLQKHGVNIPTAQSFFNYVLLAAVFATILCCRKEGRSLWEVLRTWGWRYILIAIIDVEANYFVVKAYAYTTVTSIQLLDCFSLVSVMVLSRLCLKILYRAQHIIGAVICLGGMVGLVLTDVLVGQNENQSSNVALGDVLVIVGAILYGVSNVCEEYVVRKYDKVEFLAMVGLFGSFINGAQLVILERDEVGTLDLSSYETVVPLVIFVISLFTFYSTMTIVIQLTSATAVNLSILSADFYTLLFGLFLFSYKFHVLYFVAFTVILVGLAIYSLTPALAEPQQQREDEVSSCTVNGGQPAVVSYNTTSFQDPVRNDDDKTLGITSSAIDSTDSEKVETSR